MTDKINYKTPTIKYAVCRHCSSLYNGTKCLRDIKEPFDNCWNAEIRQLQQQRKIANEAERENKHLEELRQEKNQIFVDIINLMYPNKTEDEKFDIAFNGDWYDDLKDKLTQLQQAKQQLAQKEQALEKIKEYLKLIGFICFK